jgi:hypothetical protein
VAPKFTENLCTVVLEYAGRRSIKPGGFETEREISASVVCLRLEFIARKYIYYEGRHKVILGPRKEIVLEVNAEKTKCRVMPCEQNAEQNRKIKKGGNKFFENMAQFRCFWNETIKTKLHA